MLTTYLADPVGRPAPWIDNDLGPLGFAPQGLARLVVDVIPSDVRPTLDGHALIRDGRLMRASEVDDLIARAVRSLERRSSEQLDALAQTHIAQAAALDSLAEAAFAVAYASDVHAAMPDDDTRAALVAALSAWAPSRRLVDEGSLDLDSRDDLDVIADAARRDARNMSSAADQMRRRDEWRSSDLGVLDDMLLRAGQSLSRRPHYAARVRRAVIRQIAAERGPTLAETADRLVDVLGPGWVTQPDLIGACGLRGRDLIDVVSLIDADMAARIASGRSPWRKRHGILGAVIAPRIT